ncbi:MAG: transporter [Syntrophus sp. RIFOXYC2_FULL_54_9]|nr:MAG: transporter [Syntrophus sp. RIFOXYC2_FULL_54_9]HBB18741.1 transporter [Syntrophus sp. (in: bacteria)]
MEGLSLLYNGFVNSLTMVNLFACFIGALIGTIVGVLPGLGPTATMALMLPFTLSYGPTTGLIMMTGVWYGAMYGGSTTSVLVNIPGEAASVVTCLDGYQMCKKGRAGAALALVAVGSFIAGTLGILGLQFFAPFLGNAALSFGPPEFLCFMILAFVLLSNLSSDSPLKGALMIAFGLFLSSIGINPMDSYPRFTYGSDTLMQGIDFLPIAMGLFGISEILNIALETYVKPEVNKIRLRDLYPSKEEVRRSIAPTLRGSILGFFVGLLPGPCTVISTFVSYSLEKRISKTPEEFGHGAVEGVVAPESANNSAVMGSMIPLLTLGIPFAAPSAIMLAGLRMHNVEPGPMLFANNPEVFWTFIAAMYLGNIMLLILNLPLVGVFGRIAVIRPQVLMPVISLICLVGVYSVRNSFFDVWVMIAAGVVGFFLRKWKYPIAPFIIGVVLGPTTENSLRQTLMTFKGDLSLIMNRRISVTLLALAVAFLAYKFLSPYLGKKFALKVEPDDTL